MRQIGERQREGEGERGNSAQEGKIYESERGMKNHTHSERGEKEEEKR